VGSYQMTLFVELANYPTLTPEIGLEIPFTITVDSACLNTQFYYGSPPKLLHQVGKDPVFARMSAKDSVSIEGSDGHSFCGKRTFELGPAPYVWVDVDSPVGFSTTMYLNGTYDYFREQIATIRLGLEEYPSFVKQSFDFPVYIIDMCEEAQIEFLYSYEDGINYVLGSKGYPISNIFATSNLDRIVALWGFSPYLNVQICGNAPGKIEHFLEDT